jgi:hypothetical protein
MVSLNLRGFIEPNFAIASTFPAYSCARKFLDNSRDFRT